MASTLVRCLDAEAEPVCLYSLVGCACLLSELLAGAALSGQQSDLEGLYSAGSAFLQNYLGIQSAGERSRILDMAMNPNSMYALRPDRKGAANASVSGNLFTCMHCMSFLAQVWRSVCC